MSRFSQEGRLFMVSTPLDRDALVLQRFHGDEGISVPFHYVLELLSEDDAVDPASMLREPMVITIELQDGEERKIHGVVRRFRQMGQQDDVTFYEAEIVPWFWFLTLSHDCKIFQNKSVPDIVQEVFDGLGYSDYELRCSKSYQPREYCVQYRESHFNFVSRLLEEEGMFYFFEHSDEKHVLVIADMNSTCVACPGQDTVRIVPEEGPFHEEDVVTSISLETTVHLGKVTLRDYDFTRPSLNLETSVADEDPEERYDYPGQYIDLGEGERYAQLLLEEGTGGSHVVRGASNCRAFQSGFKTTLQEHYRSDANTDYIILQISHRGEGGDYRSWDTATADYRNTFVWTPLSVPYRPPHRSRKPRVHGSQTALVVGPSGEEVYTDEYGRVKVQFYWDRLGSKDQNSSCWVRVSFPWAGKRYGSVSIPRIGNEVIVDFLEGNPDRPIITGSVYKAEQPTPFDLPDSGIQMGMKSRSSPGGGGYNEITMTDTKGKEQITIHAQYDMGTTVEHDDTQTVNNDRTITVVGKHTETIKKDCKITILGKLTEEITKDTSVKILEGNHTVTVSAGTQSTTVNKDISIKSETKFVKVNAATEIQLSVGASSLLMKKDGTIELKGKNLLIDGSTKVAAHGAAVSVMGDDTVKVSSSKVEMTGGKEVKVGVGSQQMTCDTTKVAVSGAAINSSAVGMHEIAGALVKIN
jgi:type VI secretion system secreted protein VgrG